jgi:hypothetical protein
MIYGYQKVIQTLFFNIFVGTLSNSYILFRLDFLDFYPGPFPFPDCLGGSRLRSREIKVIRVKVFVHALILKIYDADSPVCVKVDIVRKY